MGRTFWSVAVLMCFLSATATGSPEVLRSDEVQWPDRGVELCQYIRHGETRHNCTHCFSNAGSDFLQIKECVTTWLPRRFASCVKPAVEGEDEEAVKAKFERCLEKQERYLRREIERADRLYTKGGEYLRRVGDSNIIEDGPAAVFSCMAQELIMSGRGMQESLGENCGSCFNRFQMDPLNAEWHLGRPSPTQDEEGRKKRQHKVKRRKSRALLKASTKADAGSVKSLPINDIPSKADNPKERTLVYQYGYVGHDMPFHGVGSISVDYMKGRCIFCALADNGALGPLLEAVLSSTKPVPAWIFRELLNNVTSVEFPE